MVQLTGYDSQSLVIARVAEREARAGDNREPVDILAGSVERDRDREERAVGEAERGHAALVVLLAHESFERAETAVHDQFQVAQLAL